MYHSGVCKVDTLHQLRIENVHADTSSRNLVLREPQASEGLDTEVAVSSEGRNITELIEVSSLEDAPEGAP